MKLPNYRSQDKYVGPKKNYRFFSFFSLLFSFFIGFLVLYIKKNLLLAVLVFSGLFLLLNIYYIFNLKLKKNLRIKKIEEVFPDFIELVASNLRAGMTVDKALLLSSRKEYSPLDEEILRLGKSILTGQEIDSAMNELSKRIGSPKIQKTVDLIISGLRSGGNLAVILEETAVNLRERGFVEKRAASNVLMYLILIFFATTIGAPILFSLSGILVEILTRIIGNMPATDAVSNLPFSLREVSISTNFITYYSVMFILMIDIMACLMLGLIRRGDEKEGLRYIFIFVFISLAIYFLVKLLLVGYFASSFG